MFTWMKPYYALRSLNTAIVIKKVYFVLHILKKFSLHNECCSIL
jgi:hypothetical protein